MNAIPLTVTEAAAALRAGTVTATELMDHALQRADQLDAQLGVYITRYDDSARAAAAAVDDRVAAGETLRPLEGIPLGVKDIFAESQGPTTAQSLVLDPAWAEAVGEAVTVTRLKEAGAIVTGKVTTMEFAMGAPDPQKPFPIPRNAWDLERWAGGSSSGSGSGVAAGMFLAANGTDTGGSIRIPSAYNGVTGIKPTYGLVPNSGLTPLSFSMDHVGPLARSAADCALLLTTMAGADPSDQDSVQRPALDYPSLLTGELAGVRIGVDDLDRFADGGIDPRQADLFAAALSHLSDAGADLVPVQLPMYREVTVVGIVTMLSEALAYHRNDLVSRWDDYSQSLRIGLALGDAFTAADYIQAQRVRRIAGDKLRDLFSQVDLVVTPTAHMGAPRLDSMSHLRPLESMPSMHTIYWDPMGNPSLSLPIGLSAESTPLAMSIIGAHWADGLVLRAGDAIQQRSQHHLTLSPLVAQPQPA
ncbi:amidase [Gryllotalpicola protaetiae]|uniref:Amidase n=1 Tax=Gryllotalpicola protaetiae TaxID=2419771 RepID=A0A387BMK0_9MICO|nr:amidase [Gryllotalpicola protaetiae]AYG02217.1 amidase [Gryllotalpicola protaetiae]